MEKLLRRSILNRNQLVAKKRRESAKDLRKEWREYNRYKNMQQTEMQHMIKRERVARREDWMLGPLAPKRDAGFQKERYGAVDSIAARAPPLPKRESRIPRGMGYDPHGSERKRTPGYNKLHKGEWKGNALEANLVPGDRVVIINGRPEIKGKIGEVTMIEQESRTVFVRDVNKVDVVVPPQNEVASDGAKFFEQELPIPISDVRLVTQAIDKSGVKRDVIVRAVIGRSPYLQRTEGSNLPRHTRYIVGGYSGHGPDVEIPWPAEDPERFYTQPGDTTSDVVDSETFRPYLLSTPPLPEGAIDELRKPHARSRREYDNIPLMQRKMLEDARKDWFAKRSEILSQPFWTKEYMEREKKAATKYKA